MKRIASFLLLLLSTTITFAQTSSTGKNIATNKLLRPTAAFYQDGDAIKDKAQSKLFIDHYIQASELTKKGEYSRAIQALEKCLQIYPLAGSANFMLGNIYLTMADDPKDRSSLLQKAVAQFTAAVQSHPGLAAGYYNRALSRMKLGDWDAIDDLDQCLQLDPAQADAYYMRSQLHRALKQNDKAEADLKRFRELGGKV